MYFKIILCASILITSVRSAPLQNADVVPEQIHLAYGGTPTTIYVTWVTLAKASSAEVVYFPMTEPIEHKAVGNTTEFTDGGAAKRKIYVHRATLEGLMPGTKYGYKVGNDGQYSAVFNFTMVKEGPNGFRYAVYGDLGLKNPKSLKRLQAEVDNGNIDVVLHVGDFGYNLNDDEGKVGDGFFNMIQPIATRVPYMAVPGNHESAYNFSQYVNRFTMPNTLSNHWNSYDLGPVHFIGFSTEFFFYSEYFGAQQIENQKNWLLHDLIKATQNRKNVPWIIVMGHRPMYCSNSDHDDCTENESKVRKGVEKLFYDSGVDLMIWAHEHSYERLWPIYNRKYYNNSDAYKNPPAPTHVITGSAGCQEDHDHFKPIKPHWSAFRSIDYGYSKMQVHNHTHLYLEQISDDKGGKVIDSFWLIREQHGPYTQEDEKRMLEYGIEM